MFINNKQNNHKSGLLHLLANSQYALGLLEVKRSVSATVYATVYTLDTVKLLLIHITEKVSC